MPRTAILVTALITVLLVAGCDTVIAGHPLRAGAATPAAGSPEGDRALVEDYFAELNAAGEEGTESQGDFLRRTQHPDYTEWLCDLSGLTLHMSPAMSTFRVDQEWKPPDAEERPRGTVYVLGVSIAIRDRGALLGEQIGSQRVVVLDGQAYGFSPCPAG